MFDNKAHIKAIVHKLQAQDSQAPGVAAKRPAAAVPNFPFLHENENIPPPFPPSRQAYPGFHESGRIGLFRGIARGGTTKQGDGQPWPPALTVKGGASGFYRIKVGK